MPDWAIIALACATVIYILSRINLYIDLRYVRLGDNDDLTVSIYLLRHFLIYKIHVPVIELTKSGEIPWIKSKLSTTTCMVKTYPKRERRFVLRLLTIYLKRPARWEKLMQKFHHYQRIYLHVTHQITKRIHCEKLRLIVVYGSGDAAITGILTGVFWAISGLIIHRLRQRLSFSQSPQFSMEAQFTKQCLTIDFACIFRLSIGDVISTSVSLANYTRKGATRNG